MVTLATCSVRLPVTRDTHGLLAGDTVGGSRVLALAKLSTWRLCQLKSPVVLLTLGDMQQSAAILALKGTTVNAE